MTKCEKLMLQIRRSFQVRDWKAWNFYYDILDRTAPDEETE